ncbi:MAG: hypothetical protein E7171_00465 [Firmicutes bacterium]|nr:hypothetical protein [Bacillota bacterium]
MFEIIQPYLLEIIVAILTGIASFIGVKVKKVYEEYVDTKTKKEIVECTVKYVEQVYKTIHGEEKLEKAKDKALEWLNEKGITISDTELEILIEASVNGFNNGLEKASKE